MKRKRILAKQVLAAAGWVVTASLMPTAPALGADHAAAGNASASEARDVTGTASGEVRRVDKSAGKVAIKHGAIAALELPPMTLVYLAEPALLINIEAGDRVRFTAARRSGQYILLEISN